MPVVTMREILDRAFAERYGVAAINVVDDLSLEAVLAAATDLDAPLIVQTSLKTVKSIGAKPFYALWRARADDVPVPVTLHLDHCPDREWISICLDAPLIVQTSLKTVKSIGAKPFYALWRARADDVPV